MEVKEVASRLVHIIEYAPVSLHRYNASYDQCNRLKKGLAVTTARDCDCGLDALLAEAHQLKFNEQDLDKLIAERGDAMDKGSEHDGGAQ
mgnify:CR=1 FL=1